MANRRVLNVLATASEMTQLVASKGYESGVAGVRTVTPFFAGTEFVMQAFEKVRSSGLTCQVIF